jgi:sulfide:quinone oxidoreductase
MNQPITLRPIAEDIYVAPQLGPEHLAEVAKAGFRSVINNRPDYEAGPDQPTDAQMAAAAAAAGLEYGYLPVDSAASTPGAPARLTLMLAELPRPLLMYCRSGNRSARLYQLAQQS